METLLLKGKAVSDAIRSSLEPRVKALKEDGIVPKLGAILVGDDPASQVYVRSKARAFEQLSCKSQTFKLESGSGEADVLALIDQLNNNQDIHGILVQLPLPPHLGSKKILHTISPDKDVDGLHPQWPNGLGECLLHSGTHDRRPFSARSAPLDGTGDDRAADPSPLTSGD